METPNNNANQPSSFNLHPPTQRGLPRPKSVQPKAVQPSPPSTPPPPPTPVSQPSPPPIPKPVIKEKPFETTVRVMDKKKTRKVEFVNPQPTKMVITSKEIVFSGDPEKQDNSFLKGKAEYIIPKESIKEIKFNQIINSSIRVVFEDNGEQVIHIQYLSGNAVGPEVVQMTQRIYDNMDKFLKGEELEKGNIPIWFHILIFILTLVVFSLAGLIEIVIYFVFVYLAYKFIGPKVAK